MVAQNTMRAVQFRSYGAPEVLKVGAVEIPSPGPKEVVVEVAAFSVNAVDLLTRRGKMRLLDGMGFPKGTGVDFAGLVHAVGDQVGIPGDEASRPYGCWGAVRASPARPPRPCS